MYTTARPISTSEKLPPPCGGMAPLPLRAECSSVSKPCLMRGAQSPALPNLGAPDTPVAWQAEHWALYTSSPLASGRLASRISTVPTFWMRAAIFCAASVSPGDGPCPS
jgi:hypothetical protein